MSKLRSVRDFLFVPVLVAKIIICAPFPVLNEPLVLFQEQCFDLADKETLLIRANELIGLLKLPK